MTRSVVHVALTGDDLTYLIDRIGDSFDADDITGHCLYLQLLLARDALRRDQWISQAEACAALNCSMSTLRESGLVSFHSDGTPRVARAAVEEFVNAEL